MISKSKLLRLYTLRRRLESIVNDFSNSSDVPDDIISFLCHVNNSLSDLIEHVSTKD